MLAEGQEEASLGVDTDFAGAVGVVGDDGFSGSHGLREGAGQAFAAREVGEDVHDADEFGDGAGWYEAGEDEVTSDSEVAGALFERGSERAIADEEEADVWAGFCERRGDGEEMFVAFQGG